MIKQLINLPEDFNTYPAIVEDYINKPEKLNSFISPISSAENIMANLTKRNFDNKKREILVDVLLEQYKHIEISKPVYHNIQLLKNHNCFTVTTGHQLCLLSGPLFVTYKILSTIRLAQILKEKIPQNNFVPVFWMASEDHDFEEINHVHLFNKKYIWNDKQGGAVGEYSTKTLSELINQLEPLFQNSETSKKYGAIIKNAYQQKNLSKATCYLINQLFGEYGLLILDANNPKLKSLFSSILKEEITNQFTLKEILRTNQKLSELNYTPVIEPKEINLFYLDKNKRERIELDGDLFKVRNTNLTFNQKEILNLIENEPQRFSPNVALRPLYQETILPNLAYIGGPNEIAYWMQLKGVFDYSNTPFPALVLRKSFFLIDEKTINQFLDAGFSIEDLSRPTEDLTATYLNKKNFIPFETFIYENEISKIFNDLKIEISKIDTTLVASLKAEEQKLKNSLRNLQNKINKVLKQKHEQPIGAIKKIKERLFPNHIPQERYENVFNYLVRDEENKLLNQLLTNSDAFRHKAILFVL